MEGSPLASELGVMLANFAMLETKLVDLFGRLIGNDTAAKLVWAEVPSFVTKLKIMRKLATHSDLAVFALLQRADETNAERNRYIHASWGGSGVDSLMRWANSGKGNSEMITTARLADFAQSIGRLSWDIDAYLSPQHYEKNP